MRRGILSSLNVNFTDNKTAYNTRNISKRLSDAFDVYKTNQKLQNVLYYTTNNTEQVGFIPYTQNNRYSGITITRMTDSSFNLLNNYLITFVGYRIPAGSNLLTAQYNETVTINTPVGNIVAAATYSDSGTEFISTIDFQRYLVLNGDGIYVNSSHIIIYFDNDGSKFGVAHSRKIEIYKNFL